VVGTTDPYVHILVFLDRRHINIIIFLVITSNYDHNVRINVITFVYISVCAV
jgi:hypothetical protein